MSWQMVEHLFAAFGVLCYLVLAHRLAQMAIGDRDDGPVHRLPAPLKHLAAYLLFLFWPVWGFCVVLDLVWESWNA